jgi:mannose-1-phosphate guanylyltransferase/phosphomannomutase
LESIYNPDVLKDQGHYNQTVYFDGILTLVKIMEYMAVNRISLSELNQLLPPYHICVDHEYCSWDNKGMVMRRLIQEHQEDQIELLDGLKVKREDGWVLVLPDIEGPRYQIISEGFNQEVAEELTNFYKDKIKVLQS